MAGGKFRLQRLHQGPGPHACHENNEVKMPFFELVEKLEGFMVFGERDFPHGSRYPGLAPVSLNKKLHLLTHAASKKADGKPAETEFFTVFQCRGQTQSFQNTR